jgi:hypothetical protein
MNRATLMALLLIAAPVMADSKPDNLEQVIEKARKDGATIIECTAGWCYDKYTMAPADAETYKDSPDGIYIQFKNPAEDSYKLLDEAAQIVKETQDSLSKPTN